MSEQVNKMIDALDQDDHIEAETAFKSALVDKVGAVLDDKRKDLAKTFVRAGETVSPAETSGDENVDTVQPTEQPDTGA
jgi:hypothetical protein